MLDDDPDNDLGPMSESDRAAAEAALRRRDREEGRRVRGMRRGLLYDDESDDEVSEWAVHAIWFRRGQAMRASTRGIYLVGHLKF